MTEELENCNFVGKVKLSDTIYEKRYNSATVKDRMLLQWTNFPQYPV